MRNYNYFSKSIIYKILMRILRSPTLEAYKTKTVYDTELFYTPLNWQYTVDYIYKDKEKKN